MSLQIRLVEKTPGVFELGLVGRLDTETYETLETHLDGILNQKVQSIRVDMSGLDYISSMGLRTLLKTFQALRKQEAHLVMHDLQPQIKKVFEIAAALPLQSIFGSVQEADTYLDAMQRKITEGEE